MTLESMLAFVGFTAAIFSLGYMIGKDLNKNRNDRP
jgi:hypothetical protein